MRRPWRVQDSPLPAGDRKIYDTPQAKCLRCLSVRAACAFLLRAIHEKTRLERYEPYGRYAARTPSPLARPGSRPRGRPRTAGRAAAERGGREGALRRRAGVACGPCTDRDAAAARLGRKPGAKRRPPRGAVRVAKRLGQPRCGRPRARRDGEDRIPAGPSRSGPALFGPDRTSTPPARQVGEKSLPCWARRPGSRPLGVA